MTEYRFTSISHRHWVDANPKEAFEAVLQKTKLAEQLLQEDQPRQAIPYLGNAFETAEIIFEKRLESPQLTTTLTSIGIMLAHAYASTNQLDSANRLLKKLRNKMQCAIECALGYAAKVAFFEHCSQAITEASTDIMLNMNTSVARTTNQMRIH